MFNFSCSLILLSFSFPPLLLVDVSVMKIVSKCVRIDKLVLSHAAGHIKLLFYVFYCRIMDNHFHSCSWICHLCMVGVASYPKWFNFSAFPFLLKEILLSLQVCTGAKSEQQSKLAARKVCLGLWKAYRL